jgi:magnesium-transporting ATPase (P-type)
MTVRTAKAIRNECGIRAKDGGRINITSNNFRKMLKLELLETLHPLQILAPFTPMDKFCVVPTLRECREIVTVIAHTIPHTVGTM